MVFLGKQHDFPMKKIIGKTVLTLVLVICCYFFVDTRIALVVRGAWLSHARLDVFAADIPDLLLFFVCGVTGFGWAVYFHRAHRGIFDNHTRFFRLIAITVPLTFFLKSLLKIAVGRITTRFWLDHPGYPEFHWFNGRSHYDGFPSGHMAVFVALGIALWEFYPRQRILYAISLSVLAIALIVTDYHFVSDIIAGAYLGLIVHGGVHDHLSLMLNSCEENRRIPAKE